MQPFLGQDFLLSTDTARQLFHTYAKGMPLFDYHCHLSAKEIWEDKPFDNLGRMWLEHDHYKWRVMRASGVPERLVTGSASWHDKFLAFARILPGAIGNPVYHWSHLELWRYFHIQEPISASNAEKIWEKSSEVIRTEGFSPRHLIEISDVQTLCTTEDPADTLAYHQKLAGTGWKVRVLPAWRPDKVIKVEKSGFASYLQDLSEAAGIPIHDYHSLWAALDRRMDAFDAAGCVASDHDVTTLGGRVLSDGEMEAVLRKKLGGAGLDAEEVAGWKTTMMVALARQYARRGWVMELHIGCERDQNTRGVGIAGEAAGFDSVGDGQVARPLGSFLNYLEVTGELPKTVLFCLNPKDNWVLAALANTFQDDSIPGKIQFGTAWWFQDHIPGMRMQMESYATSGVLANFIGMLSDSRSYLSYPRFEYFRRLLCSYIGELVESGQYPDDIEYLGNMVRGICFENAKRFFQKSR